MGTVPLGSVTLSQLVTFKMGINMDSGREHGTHPPKAWDLRWRSPALRGDTARWETSCLLIQSFLLGVSQVLHVLAPSSICSLVTQEEVKLPLEPGEFIFPLPVCSGHHLPCANCYLPQRAWGPTTCWVSWVGAFIAHVITLMPFKASVKISFK